MVRDYGGRAVELDLAGLQTDIGIMPARLLSVLAATKTWLAQGGRDPSSLYDVFQAAEARKGEIGRASGQERVCQYGSISVVAVSLQKQKNKTNRYTPTQH